MPYESIDEGMYLDKVAKLSKLKLGLIKGEEAIAEKYCTNDICELQTA